MALSERFETIRFLIGHPGNKNRRLLAFLDYLRWNMGHRLLPVDYVLPLVENARLILSKRQNYATLTYASQLWDFPEMMFLLHFLRPGDVFADVGSNVGGYTVLASAIAGCKSVAFEPVPATFSELLVNIRLNDILSLVDARLSGLGRATGTLRMTATRGGLNHIATQTTRGLTVDVAVVRLDDALDGQVINLLKLDAEGYETNILAGAQATLSNLALHAVIVELNGSGERYGFSDEGVHAELSRFGFSPAAYDAHARKLNIVKNYKAKSLNTIYVRNSKHLVDRLMTARPIAFRGSQI